MSRECRDRKWREYGVRKWRGKIKWESGETLFILKLDWECGYNIEGEIVKRSGKNAGWGSESYYRKIKQDSWEKVGWESGDRLDSQ